MITELIQRYQMLLKKEMNPYYESKISWEESILSKIKELEKINLVNR